MYLTENLLSSRNLDIIQNGRIARVSEFSYDIYILVAIYAYTLDG